MLTVDEVKAALPTTLKAAATQHLVDQINNASSDPVMAENIRENFISYTRILQDGKFKTEDYLSAVMYVSYKLMGCTNIEAYTRTFPKRYADAVARGLAQKDIASFVTAYHKGKLVNLIMEQTLIPVHILNQDAYQKAINVQVELMTTAFSEKVRCDAANSILTHLAKPKEAVPALNINIGQTGMPEMEQLLVRLAKAQQEAIGQGVPILEITAQPLIEDGVVINGSN